MILQWTFILDSESASVYSMIAGLFPYFRARTLICVKYNLQWLPWVQNPPEACVVRQEATPFVLEQYAMCVSEKLIQVKPSPIVRAASIHQYRFDAGLLWQ